MRVKMWRQQINIVGNNDLSFFRWSLTLSGDRLKIPFVAVRQCPPQGRTTHHHHDLRAAKLRSEVFNHFTSSSRLTIRDPILLACLGLWLAPCSAGLLCRVIVPTKAALLVSGAELSHTPSCKEPRSDRNGPAASEHPPNTRPKPASSAFYFSPPSSGHPRQPFNHQPSTQDTREQIASPVPLFMFNFSALSYPLAATINASYNHAPNTLFYFPLDVYTTVTTLPPFHSNH